MASGIVNIFRVVGEIGVPVRGTFEGVDLTGYTVTGRIKYEFGGRLEIVATITDAAAGMFEMPFAANELIEGDHGLEFEFVDPSANVSILPRASTMLLSVRCATELPQAQFGGGGTDFVIKSSEGTLVIDTVSVSTGGALPPTTGNDGYALIEVGSVAAWRAIKADYIVPVFSIDSFALGVASVREVGESVIAPNFTATYNRPSDTATLTDNDGNGPTDVSGTPTAFASPFTFQKSSNNASVAFTLTAVEDGDASSPLATSMLWQPRTFYGVDVDGLSTEADIEGLASQQLDANRNITFTVNPGAGQHIYYAYPTSYGAATFTVGGFAGGFTLVSSVISVTNAFAVAQDYRLYKSNSANLGSTQVVVS